MNSRFVDSRRSFFKTTAAFGVGYWVAGRAVADDSRRPRRRRSSTLPASAWEAWDRATPAKPRWRATSSRSVTSTKTTWTRQPSAFPARRSFIDFRELFDEMSGKIDAVTVSTPDHVHALAAARAMREGKHVYCQKPLTHSCGKPGEWREIAREMKVVTQMGNQGTAGAGCAVRRRSCRSGRWGR